MIDCPKMQLFRNHCVSCFKLNLSHFLHLRKVETKKDKNGKNQTKINIDQGQKAMEQQKLDYYFIYIRLTLRKLPLHRN